jgi:hypothetical protein
MCFFHEERMQFQLLMAIQVASCVCSDQTILKFSYELMRMADESFG